MMYENDKLIIPEKYKKMSVSELREEKNRVYMEIKQSSEEITKRTEQKKETIKFYL